MVLTTPPRAKVPTRYLREEEEKKKKREEEKKKRERERERREEEIPGEKMNEKMLVVVCMLHKLLTAP